MEWTSADSDATVLERIGVAIRDPGLVEEHVRVLLAPGAATGFGVVAASTFHKELQLALEVHSTKPTLDSVELLRTSGSGTMPAALAQAIWSALELSYVRRARCTAGVAGLMEQDALVRLTSLRMLNLSHSELASLPSMVGLLQVRATAAIGGGKGGRVGIGSVSMKRQKKGGKPPRCVHMVRGKLLVVRA